MPNRPAPRRVRARIRRHSPHVGAKTPPARAPPTMTALSARAEFMFGWLDPITRKRLRRFREFKRAWYSLLILMVLYLASLMAEALCNDRPLYVRYEGESFFPFLFFYPEDTFTGNGLLTRPDYKAINAAPAFTDHDENFMLFTLVPFGPQEIIQADSIPVDRRVEIRAQRDPHVGAIDIAPDFTIRRERRAQWFFPEAADTITGLRLSNLYALPQGLIEAVELRFANRPAPPWADSLRTPALRAPVRLVLSPYQTRPEAPRTVRILLREDMGEVRGEVWWYDPDTTQLSATGRIWDALAAAQRDKVMAAAQARLRAPVVDLRLEQLGVNYRVSFNKEDVRFPFRPIGPHLFGLDDTGRDVLARIFYGLRTSLNFGLLLVVASMLLGTVVGALQGYYGGKIDLAGQRLTEIWESLPFLYVLILLGSVYGRSFMLLLVVYGLFNWIGISYYMRAEFLRLRNQQFVEAARCMGLPDRKILFRHILPNALTPLTTFFPFSLVGAIGALAALDYLGFGLPPPTASWGQLLAQAQGQGYWWLILFPGLALFLVILLCVFIGEGVRNAFDPRKFTRLE